MNPRYCLFHPDDGAIYARREDGVWTQISKHEALVRCARLRNRGDEADLTEFRDLHNALTGLRAAERAANQQHAA